MEDTRKRLPQGNKKQDILKSTEVLIDLATGVTAETMHSIGTESTATGITTTEMGNGAVHKTIIDLAGATMAVADGTTPATDGAWGTLKLYTFPKGQIKIIGAKLGFKEGNIVASSAGSGLTTTADFDLGLGTVASANHGSFGLDGTQEDIVAALDIDLTSSKSDADENGFNTTDAAHDGTTTAITVNLNMRTENDGDSGIAASTLTMTGQVVLIWTNVGEKEVTPA